MGGRGALGIKDVKTLNKNLTTAKRNETRLKKIYDAKAGAVLMFDWHGEKTKERKAEYKRAVNERDQAETKYLDAKKKRESLQKKIDRLTKRKRRAGDPLF